jgi:hypothetical protein
VPHVLRRVPALASKTTTAPRLLPVPGTVAGLPRRRRAVVCRGRLPAPRGALPLLRRLLRVREPVSGCCCRDLERLLVGRRHRCWAARLGALRGPARAPPRVAPVCLRDSAAPHGARTARERPGTTAGTRYSCAKPKLPRENLNFELVFASWLLC